MIKGWSTFRRGKVPGGHLSQSLFYRWGNWGRGGLNDESTLTKLVSSTVLNQCFEAFHLVFPVILCSQSLITAKALMLKCSPQQNWGLFLLDFFFFNLRGWMTIFLGQGAGEVQKGEYFSGNHCEPEHLLRVLCFGTHLYTCNHFFFHIILSLFTLR